MEHYATDARTFDTLSLYLSALLGGFLTAKDRAIACLWGKALWAWCLAVWYGVNELFYPEPVPCRCDLCDLCDLCEPAPAEMIEPALQARLDDLAREACRGELEAMAELGWLPGDHPCSYRTQVVLVHEDYDVSTAGSVWAYEDEDHDDEAEVLLGVPAVNITPPSLPEVKFPAIEHPEDVIARIERKPGGNTLCVPDDLSQLDWAAFKALCREMEIKVKGKREHLEAAVRLALGKNQ